MGASKPCTVFPEEPKCYVCDKVFTFCHNMLQHLKTVHKLKGQGTRHNCYQCSDSFSAPSELLRHVTDIHHFQLVVVHLRFESEDAFSTWKQDEEAKWCSKYVCNTGAKPLVDGSMRQCFECHRSGKMKASRGKGERMMKSQGSCKSGKKCFATMTVTTQGKAKEVIYQKQHCRHGHWTPNADR
ncbi:zinc finger protein 54-like [Ixodes scapularis]|uniref:zinc finger protein 54-like n=1 Tax=Ixodes scapularis TaxID=6945 RepID=UPI0011619B6B|nr:zinc finger protein 54-like [Ixodes scapularis]